jgi:CheY-like chemotaxis protein
MHNTLRILIIDDNPSLVTIFSKMLQIKGYSVSTTATLQNGLYVLREPYDIVFVDSPIDNYNEDEIFHILKDNHILHKTKVFLFSPLEIDQMKLEVWKKDGLYLYIKKPAKRDLIIKELSSIRSKLDSVNSPQTISESTPQTISESTPQTISESTQLMLETKLIQQEILAAKAQLEFLSAQDQIQSKFEENLKTTIVVPSNTNIQSQDIQLSEEHSSKKIDIQDTSLSKISNTISVLYSLKSRFDKYVKVTPSQIIQDTPTNDQNIQNNIKSEIAEILSEISTLKNQIQFLDETDEIKTANKTIDGKEIKKKIIETKKKTLKTTAKKKIAKKNIKNKKLKKF